MSFVTRLRRLSRWGTGPAPEARPDPGTAPEADPDPALGAAPAAAPDERPSEIRRRVRLVAGWMATAAASLLVLFALTMPNELSLLTPGAFLRIPLEGLVAVALILLLPATAKRVVAAIVGIALGVLIILKAFDIGFFEVLARPFDPVLDWSLVAAAVEYQTGSMGRAGTIGLVVAAVVLAAGLLVAMTVASLHLHQVVVRHRAKATVVVAGFGVGWIVCALLAVQIIPGVPVATHEYDRLLQVRAGLQDRVEFTAEAAVDPFRDTPGDELLTALRGKDVMIVFIESYGRDAVANPEFAPQVGALLEEGDRRLNEAGFRSQSGFLTAATAGGASWLNHATLRSGLLINNQQRHNNLVASNRLTLNGAFQRAGWRTVAVMPGIQRAWPEGASFGYDQIYDAPSMGYRGPRLNWGIIPDQYAMATFQRSERAIADRGPVMAEIALLSSHVPWTPIPRLMDWDEIGDGATMEPVAPMREPADPLLRDPTLVRADYREAIEYSLSTLISYVETYGDEDLVFIFLGDHQPVRLITGDNASRDVPISIVSADPAVLAQVAGWGWQDGLLPGPQAPVWPMEDFRDEFLTTFGSTAYSDRTPTLPAMPPAQPAR